jgi:hypothetical protein
VALLGVDKISEAIGGLRGPRGLWFYVMLNINGGTIYY